MEGMTIDEAIARAKEVAGYAGKKASAEMEQLAEWLEELKALRTEKNKRNDHIMVLLEGIKVIDEKKLIKSLENWKDMKFDEDDLVMSVTNSTKEAVITCIIETIKCQQKVGDWVPVSKRMPLYPKENPAFEGKTLELYLVTEENAEYPFRAFWNGRYFHDGFRKVDVVAWMPLPEPYRPEGEE